MIVLVVRTPGADGTTVARTSATLDGSVITALRPELLDMPEVVERHLAEVGERLQQQRRYLRRVDRILSGVGWAVVPAMAGAALMSTQHALLGAAREAAWWAAGMLVGELARRLLPKLVRWVARRWLARGSAGPSPH
jgi:hypothetical protein